MARMSAFADKQSDITIEPKPAAVIDDFHPKMTAEAYTVNTQSGACLEMEIHYALELIKFSGLANGWNTITFSEARELVRLLAWASRKIEEREV